MCFRALCQLTLSIMNTQSVKRQTTMSALIFIYKISTMLLTLTLVSSQPQLKDISNPNRTQTNSMELSTTNDDDEGQTTGGLNATFSNDNLSLDNNINSVKCGNTQRMADNCFRDLPPHLMEFLQTSKVAINQEDIQSKCNVFQRGMECFDEYTSRCIPQKNINILNNNVEGARKFFTKFCEDKTFQNDYLTHKDCFSYVQEDWMHCTKSFQNILAEGLHSDKNVTDKFLEFCCARFAYETCIYNSARYKCYKNSATFARATAQMLTDEKHFSNCRQFEVSTCSSPPVFAQSQRCHWTLWLAIILLLMMQMMLMLPQRWRLAVGD